MKIKICGLSRKEDIAAANEARPDYIGFVFAESKRRVTFSRAAALRERLAPGITPVGVFVNAPTNEIIALYRAGVIEIAQLHGGEGEAYIAELPMPVIKAIKVHESRETCADYLLLDSGKGSGRAFDWAQIGRIERPYFLAGGISLENMEEAMRYKPYAIDVSSGAETGGLKDRAKIIALTEKVRRFS